MSAARTSAAARSKRTGHTSQRAVILQLLAIFLFLLLQNGVADAREVPVDLKSRFLHYSDPDQTLVATGEVHVKIEDVEFETDKLYLNTETNTATSEGKVTIESKQYRAEADSFFYSAQEKTTRITNFKAAFTPPEEDVKGEVYISADEFTDKDKKQVGREAHSTTCDLSLPHYHISTKHFEHIPDDKIVGVHNILWVGPVPVMYLPYYVYNMKRKQSPSIQFGETATEGRFVKTSLDYYLGAALGGGLLLLDTFERKGFGKGFQHDYELGENVEGNLTLYHLEEQDTGITDLVSKWNHKLIIPSNSMEVEVKYDTTDIYAVPTGRRNQSESTLRLQRKGSPWPYQFLINTFDNRFSNFERGNLRLSLSPPGHSFNYAGILNRNRVTPKRQGFQEQVQWAGPFPLRNSRFQFATSHTQNQSSEIAPIDEQLHPSLSLQFTEPNYTLNIRAKEYYRLRENQFPTSANDQFIKEIPFIEARSKPLKGNFFTMTPRVGYGNFLESKFFSSLARVRQFETGRLELGTEMRRVDNLGTHSQFVTTLDVSQRLYNPGDANYTLQESLVLQSRPTPGFRNQATYRRGFFEGNSPFYFDSYSQLYEDVRDRMDFIFWQAAQFTLDGGWNVRALRWYDLLATLQLTPAKQFTANFRTAYNLDEGRFRDLTIGSKIAPVENMSITLSIVHDLVGGTMKSGNSLFVYDFNPGRFEHANIRIGHTFDPQTREFKMRDVSIVKDLHCWELRYTYSDFKQQSNYLLVLKAFPTQPIGVGGEKGLYFEGVDKALQQQKGSQRF